MYLLYVDGSGSVKNPGEGYFVLAGIAVFERQIYHLIKELDDFVASLKLGDPDLVELHGTTILSGSEYPWKGVHRKQRVEIMTQALRVLLMAYSTTRAFGVAVHKATVAPRDPVEYAFEEICNRFNLYLSRLYNRGGKKDVDKHRGLVVMDESHYEETLQNLARSFRVRGTRWGALRNMAEVPLFVDSRASRLVQLADLVAFALWRRYERQDTQLFDTIVPRFDSEGGVLHGLVHYRPRNEQCYCPACMSRHAQQSAGDTS